MSAALSAPARSRLGRLGRIDPALALALVPVTLLAVAGWVERWVNEDGFIYFRVVDNLLAGSGPVFNAGERIEAYTSPAWLGLLAASRAVVPFASLEWIAVALGLVLSAAGLLAASVAARRLDRLIGEGGEHSVEARGARASGEGTPAVEAARRLVLPLGGLVVAAVPAFWGFVTSGLETSLVFAWLGFSFLGLVALVGEARPDAAGEAPACPPARRARAPVALAVLLGLGPLMRPDLVPFAACFLLALVLVTRPRPRRRRWAALLIAAALSVPLLYEVFRMGYFAALVPSTALAKEAGLAYWTRGLGYLENFVLPYALYLPLALLACLWAPRVAGAWRQGRRRAVTVALAPVAGALVHTVYVVRLGGDYMHARMLLPTLFAALMPVAVVTLPARRSLALPATAALVTWAVVCAVALRAPSQFGPQAGPWQILDQRAKQRETPSHPHPVTLADHDALPLSQPSVGYAARAMARPGRHVLVLDARPGRRRTADGVVEVQVPLPLGLRADAKVRAPVVIFTGSIGRLGYAAGPEVYVADRLGLADPVAARLRLGAARTARAGHEKNLAAAWFLGRFADPASVHASARFRSNRRIPAARAALGCGPLRQLLTAVDAPLTASLFLRNIGTAIELSSLRVSPDPVRARDELCRRRADG